MHNKYQKVPKKSNRHGLSEKANHSINRKCFILQTGGDNLASVWGRRSRGSSWKFSDGKYLSEPETKYLSEAGKKYLSEAEIVAAGG